MAILNGQLLPIKSHFFFFMAAMGPILPQLSVYGKELGISPIVMGSVTGVLPIAFLIAKPAFGIIVDLYRDYRKCIFMALLAVTSLCFAGLYFVPARFQGGHHIKKFHCSLIEQCNETDFQKELQCTDSKRVICTFLCENSLLNTKIYGIINNNTLCSTSICDNPANNSCNLDCMEDLEANTNCLYKSVTFWSFIILMSLGTIGFNVSNSISDAVCCDIVGDSFDYGKQRVWGTIGFGVTALLSGWIEDLFFGSTINYTPAFLIMLIFTVFDIYSCRYLKLPVLKAPDNIFKSLKTMFQSRQTVIFMIFATLAGVVDSFIIYFLFWYLEDLALSTHVTNIKLLEGLVVAAETLGAEVLFFYLSGKIIEKFGHAYSFSMCFIFYGLRFGLISIVPSPWWVLPIEFFLQGPTYALTYSTIVVYANEISPPGMSATIQGIAAGMDDGFGYAIGSILGGFLYKYVGGKESLQIFCIFSILCGVTHLILHKTYLRKYEDGTNTKYAPPQEAVRLGF